MFKLGLTGGIGSGKSTVAKILHGMGATVIDADAISRQSTQAGGLAIAAIRSHFGDAMIDAEGALDREAMRGLMTQKPEAKTQLEAIIHPIVGAEIARGLALAAQQRLRLAVLDIPLLAEGGSRWRGQLDAVWVVDCLPETQISRVSERSGWPAAQIQQVIGLQASRQKRLACADAVIFNEGISLAQLQALVQKMAQPLL